MRPVRPVDANAVMKTIRGFRNEFPESTAVRYACNVVLTILGDENQSPTLDYKDLVPQGEWIDCRGGDATCSRCGIRQKAVYDDDNEQHFCGHCGARMKGGPAHD